VIYKLNLLKKIIFFRKKKKNILKTLTLVFIANKNFFLDWTNKTLKSCTNQKRESNKKGSG